MSHLCAAHGVSQRRACDVGQIDRSTVRYLSRRGGDAELRDAIKRVSRERRRFGRRRIHVMIAQEGFELNHKKVRRICREEKLLVRRRGGGTRALGTGKPMMLPPSLSHGLQVNHCRARDERRFRILAEKGHGQNGGLTPKISSPKTPHKAGGDLGRWPPAVIQGHDTRHKGLLLFGPQPGKPIVNTGHNILLLACFG